MLNTASENLANEERKGNYFKMHPHLKKKEHTAFVKLERRVTELQIAGIFKCYQVLHPVEANRAEDYYSFKTLFLHQ